MYKQFNKESRLELATLLRAKHSIRFCAKHLGFDHSAVIREINRNKDEDGVYKYGLAHIKYLERRKSAKQPTKIIENSPYLKKKIINKLKNHDSPEQIAGVLKRENNNQTVLCHETIYQWIYNERPDLKKHLRCKKGKYRRKRGTKKREKQRELEKRRRIDQRPKIVDERARIGDWEGDTVLGKEKTQRILTHNERKSGYLIGNKIDKTSAKEIEKITIEVFKKVPKNKRHTITYDNGTEFGEYDKKKERELNIEVYRANKYCSWERGSNENTNGLLREFFPKGNYFANITQKDVDKAVYNLNHRPRKRLNYLTPHQVFKLGMKP